MVHKPKTYTHQKRKDSEHNMAVIKSEERKEKGTKRTMEQPANN